MALDATAKAAEDGLITTDRSQVGDVSESAESSKLSRRALVVETTREFSTDSDKLLEQSVVIQVESVDSRHKDDATAKVAKDGLITLCYCFLFLLIGPSLILLNKHILNDLGFKFPMMVSGLGQAVSAVGSWFLLRVLKVAPLEHEQLTPVIRLNMMLVGAAGAGTLFFGNAVYMYLSVSFCQILKSYTPAMTLGLLVVFRVDYPSRYIVLSVLGICVATSMAANGETNFNAFGVFLMMASSFCEGTKLVLTQKLMVNHKFSALEGLYRMTPICTMWLAVASALTEVPTIIREEKYHIILANLPAFAACGILGFAICMVSLLVVKRVGALSLKLLATARNAGLVLFSVIFFGEVVTSQQFISYFVALLFFTMYNYLKVNKM